MRRKTEIRDLYQIKMLSEVSAGREKEQSAIVETEIREKTQDYHSVIRLFACGQEIAVLDQGTRCCRPQYAPCSDGLYFLSDKSGTMQLWYYDIVDKKVSQLTTHRFGILEYVVSRQEQIYFVAEYEESADQKGILSIEKTKEDRQKEEDYEKNHAKHITSIVYREDGVGFLSGRKKHIFAYTPKTKETHRLTSGDHNFRDLAISEDGNMLAFVSDAVTNADIRPIHIHLWSYDLRNQKQKLLVDKDLQTERPAFADQGKTIVFAGMDGTFGWETINRLWKYDLEKEEAVCLTPSSDFDYAATDISDFRMGSSNRFVVDGENIYFLASWHGNTWLYRQSGIAEPIPVLTGDRVVQSYALDSDHQGIYYTASYPDRPAVLLHLSFEDQKEEVIYDPNAAYEREVQMAVPNPLLVQSFDDLEVGGWILKPSDFDPKKAYPLILEIHGGPGCMYANQFMHEFQVLASQGYVVAYFNPRGSSGYGQRFQSLIQRRFGGNGGGDYEDLMAAVDQVIKLPYVDANRLYVTGGSYGGFMTNWIIGHTDRFRAAVTQRSISNWSSFIGSSDLGFCEAELGHQCDFFTEQFEMQRVSPISYVRNMNTPLMILHSDHDYRCSLEQAEQLFTEMKLLGKTVEMKIFPGQSHGLSRSGRPVLREERLQTILDWFERYGGVLND